MDTRNLFHSIGYPAFKLTNCVADVEYGILAGGTQIKLFESQPTSVKIDFVDEKGTTQKTDNGEITQTDSKYRYRFNIFWETVEIGSVRGGLITSANEFEFLMYIINNKKSFSKNGSSNLFFRINHDPTLVFDDIAADTSYQCVVMSHEIFRYPEESPEYMGIRLILETSNRYDKIPYTFAYNRPGAI